LWDFDTIVLTALILISATIAFSLYGRQKATRLIIQHKNIAHRQDDRQTLKYSDKPFGILSEPKSISRKKVRN